MLRDGSRGGGGGCLQVSVSSGHLTNYMHAPRGLLARRMKASERGSQASASKVVGGVLFAVVLGSSDLKM